MGRYSENFERLKTSIESNIVTKPLLVLWTLFFLSIIMKFFYVLPFEGPIISDELVYKKNTSAILNLSFGNYHFPPLYSIFLSPGLLFGKNFYVIFKLINVLLVSSAIFPTWMFAKKWISPKKALLLCTVVCFMTFNFTYPNFLLSENLFIPLFLFSLFSFYNFLISDSIRWAILSGLLLALCLTTRYFAIVMLPAYFIPYLLVQLKRWRKGKVSLISGVVLFIVLLLIVSLYYYSAIDYFVTLSGKYANKETKMSLIGRYLIWFLIYTSFIILIISPFLYRIIENILYTIKGENAEKGHKVFLLLNVCMTLFTLLLATKHSGHRDYEVWYMLGRYVMFVAIPWIIWSFISVKDKIVLPRISILIACLLIYFGALFTLSGVFFPTTERLVMPYLSSSGYVFLKNPILLSFLVCTSTVCLFFRRQKIYLLTILIIHLFYPFISYGIMAKGIMPNYKEYFADNKIRTVYLGDRKIKNYLDFWNIKNVKYKKFTKKYNNITDNGLLVAPYKLGDIPMHSSYTHGRNIYVYTLPIINKNKKTKVVKHREIEVKSYGFRGKFKNLLWVRLQGHDRNTTVFLKNRKLATTYYDDHITLVIPKVFLKDKEYNLEFRDENNTVLSSYLVKRN